MKELWQLYDEGGNPLPGQGASKAEVFGQGLLHGAAHVWIWRDGPSGPEVLLQKRAPSKRTWPNLYDISAAGHIDLDEDPLTAALRETHEEIGLKVAERDLALLSIHRAHLAADSNAIENEFQWLYLLKIPANTQFNLQASEVSSTEWKPLANFTKEISTPKNNYVPHGSAYFDVVIQGITQAAS